MKKALLNSSSFNINMISKPLILFSFLSALLLFATAFYYKDLGCDGGWYSYPALALSRGGNPAENLLAVDSIKSTEGVKAIFWFKTYPSIRTLYTTLWFKYISKNIYSIKVLSLLELSTLIILGYFLIAKFCHDKVIALMLLAVFINDKAFILGAACDYRPDNMVAALTCLTFLTMFRQNKGFVVISGVTAGCLVLVHLTAVISLCCILCFFLLQNILSSKYAVKENYKYLFIGIFALLVFLYRDSIFDTLLFSNPVNFENVYSPWERVISSWDKGLNYILAKEFYRWKGYLFSSNIAQLLIIFTGIGLFFKRSLSLFVGDKTGIALFLSVCTGVVLYAAIDPHFAASHLTPIVPFFFLLLGHGANLDKLQKKYLARVLIIIVCLASITSIALAGKIILEGERSGYNIRALRNSLKEYIGNRDQEYIIVGPTEVWPFLQEDANVLIIDKARSLNNLEILSPIIDSVDYIMINKDYSVRGWKEAFLRYFPNQQLKLVYHIGGQHTFMTIYSVARVK